MSLRGDSAAYMEMIERLQAFGLLWTNYCDDPMVLGAPSDMPRRTGISMPGALTIGLKNCLAQFDRTRPAIVRPGFPRVSAVQLILASSKASRGSRKPIAMALRPRRSRYRVFIARLPSQFIARIADLPRTRPPLVADVCGSVDMEVVHVGAGKRKRQSRPLPVRPIAVPFNEAMQISGLGRTKLYELISSGELTCPAPLGAAAWSSLRASKNCSASTRIRRPDPPGNATAPTRGAQGRPIETRKSLTVSVKVAA